MIRLPKDARHNLAANWTLDQVRNSVLSIWFAVSEGAPMTETHHPDRLLPVRPPVCLGCRMPMRFATAERDRTYFKLRHAIFVCDCGRASDQLIAVVNWGRRLQADVADVDLVGRWPVMR
jgi:hypothetical protein